MTGQSENRQQLFDDWAGRYDDTVRRDGQFPFDGYNRVLDTVVRLADPEPELRVLDIGVGTGNLTQRFVDHDCAVWGIDFSAEMLARASAKTPQATFIQANLLDDWPEEIDCQFDRIVSAYVLHEFALATKLQLLQRFAEHLDAGGKIIVGDIAFHNQTSRQQARYYWADAWDISEHYWAAYETITTCAQIQLHATYRQVSSCGGVFVFEPL